MTDADLLALVERKTPGELSGEEVDILLRRLADSPSLRHDLLARPGMDAYITAALARARADLEPADQRALPRKRSALVPLLLIALLALPLLALVAAVIVNSNWRAARDVAQAPTAPTKVEADKADNADKAVAETAPLERPQELAPPPVPSAMQIVPLEKLRDVPGATASEPLEPAAQTPPPWQAALDREGEPPPYETIAFAPDEQTFTAPSKTELEQWLEKTPDAGLRLTTISTQQSQRTMFEGVAKLLCPWPADGVLRLKLENFNRLKMHFFHQQHGVTFVYYEDQGYRWAGYTTTRDDGKMTPKTWALTATDDDRCRRSELRYGGPIELRYRDGELILSRGDIVLLSAPLSKPPTGVFLEGRATVHGISLVRASGGPEGPQANPTAKEIARPGELAWTSAPPKIAVPQAQDGGSLRLAASNAKAGAACWTPLPQNGLQEIVLELDGITPGAGIYLGRADDKSPEVVRFVRDRRSGQLAAKLVGGESNEWQAEFDAPADKPSPLVQPHCWVKLLYGCGSVRYWLSSDGEHWAQPEMTREGAPPGIASIGLNLVANRPDAGLTLRRIEIRRLEGLAGLAPEELVDRAVTVIDSSSIDAWQTEIEKRKPAEVDLAEWRRACTLRALGAGAPRELAYPLLERLLDDMAERGLPAQEQLAALDDGMLLAGDLRDGQAMKIGIPSRYVRLGIDAAEREGLPAWTTVRRHHHSVPMNTWLHMPTDLDRVIRWELVTRAYKQPGDNQPGDNVDFLAKLRFFRQDRDRPLVDWLEMLAQRRTPATFGSEPVARPRESWRQPLIEELSKEAYNALTELKAVLDSEAWDDAARLITLLDPRAAPGLAPYVNDKSLFTSLPVAIELALSEFPQLRQSLTEKFGELAKLRINQATASGDAAALELTTIQFAGTPVLAEVHQWLGDRALTGGSFERALAEYAAARALDAEREAVLAPRTRLAAAMLGRDAESPVTESVQFGEMSLSPAEFEAVVAEMRERERSAGGNSSAMSSEPPRVPAAGGYEAHVRSRLDGPVGERPQEEVGRRTNQHRVPWADRQIAAVVEGNTMYVANRFQVAAYNLESGERLWQSPPPPGPMLRAQEWAMIAMRPLIVGERLYARMLYTANPLLVCMEKSTGKPKWIAQTREREFFVSDPLLIDGRLVCLSIAIQEEQQGLLRWLAMDAETGDLIEQRDLVRLRNTWGARGCCEVTAVNDGLVAVMGGITLAVDAEGNLRWVRTQEVLPADEDPRCVLQMYHPPLIQEGRMYVAQPGVRTVECLDVSTGKRHWSTVLPEIVGLVGFANDLLVVRTEAGLRALSIADGNMQWRHDAADLFSFQLVDSERLLYASRERVPNQNDQRQVCLTWIDSVRGQTLATTPLPKLADPDPRVGPLVPFGDRLFTFFGRGQHEATRDVVELVPSGDAGQE